MTADQGTLEEPRTLELEDGQIVLVADVEKRSGQLVLEELARPPEPAPLNHTPERTAAECREQLLELARQRCSKEA